MKISDIIKDKNKILFIVIFILAIFIRIISWPNGLSDLNCDETMLAINARSIAQTGCDIYGTKLPVYFETWVIGGQSALPTYLTALSIKIFGFSVFAIRLPALIISIVSIYVIYKLSVKIFNKEIGLIVLFLVAINPWHIMQSQWNLDCNFFPHVTLFAIYFLYSGIQDNKKSLIYISMIVFALAMYCYGISLYFVPIFLLIVGIYLLAKKKISILDLIISATIYITFSLPIILMYIVNFFELETFNIFNLTIQRFEYTVRSNDMLIFSKSILTQLIENIRTLKNIIFYQNDGLTWNSMPYFGTLYLHSLLFIIVAFVTLIYNTKEGKYKIVNVWTIVAIIIGILINGVNINRINIIWYPLIILTGYGIYTFCYFCKNKNIAKYLIFSIYLISFILFSIKYYTEYQEAITDSYTFSNGLVAACEFINSVDENEIIISESANNSGTYVYYRYAFKDDYQIPVKREEMIYYYKGKKEEVSWFNNENKEFKTENFETGSREINEKIYLIRTEESENIKNIDDYEKNIFKNYIVLVKKYK